jgi:hypothetical protein
MSTGKFALIILNGSGGPSGEIFLVPCEELTQEDVDCLEEATRCRNAESFRTALPSCTLSETAAKNPALLKACKKQADKTEEAFWIIPDEMTLQLPKSDDEALENRRRLFYAIDLVYGKDARLRKYKHAFLNPLGFVHVCYSFALT